MQVEYIQSFEKMLEVALAEDSVAKARPMSDTEIQCLAANIRKKSKSIPPKTMKAVNKDLEQTLLGMIELIQSDTQEKDKTYARKLLRRISEVAINMQDTNNRVIH